MALRIRSDGRVLCAALHQEEPGDTYIDDGLHYLLSVQHRVLVTLPMPQHTESGPRMGQWWWRGNAPSDVDD